MSQSADRHPSKAFQTNKRGIGPSLLSSCPHPQWRSVINRQHVSKWCVSSQLVLPFAPMLRRSSSHSRRRSGPQGSIPEETGFERRRDDDVEYRLDLGSGAVESACPTPQSSQISLKRPIPCRPFRPTRSAPRSQKEAERECGIWCVYFTPSICNLPLILTLVFHQLRTRRGAGPHALLCSPLLRICYLRRHPIE